MMKKEGEKGRKRERNNEKRLVGLLW